MDSLFTGLVFFLLFLIVLGVYGFVVNFIVNKIVDFVDKMKVGKVKQ